MSYQDCMVDCCHACSRCCLVLFSKKEKEDYPSIQYDRLRQVRVVGPNPVHSEVTPVHQIPLEKIFSFPQGRREYRLHPQLSGEIETVTRQPTGEPQAVSQPEAEVFRFPQPRKTHLLQIEEEASDESSDAPPMKTKKKRKAFGRSSQRRKISREDDRLYTASCESVPGSDDSQSVQEGDPLLEFSLYFDLQCSNLTVELHRAYNLPIDTHDSMLVSSVVISLLPDWEQEFETKIAVNTLSPVYNETLNFQGITAEEVQAKTLVFRVYHHITSETDQMVGMVYFPLRLTDLFVNERIRRRISKRFELQKALSRGDILLGLKYNARYNTLKVTIYKVANLYNPHLLNIQDPYVKVVLLYRESKIHTWKARVQSGTQTFVFDRYFNHDVSGLELSALSLQISVKYAMDYRMFYRKKTLGVTLIGSRVPGEHGRNHWTRMLASMGEEASMWHPLHSASAIDRSE